MSTFSSLPAQRKKFDSRKKTGVVDISTPSAFLGIPQEKFRDLIDNLPVYLWMHDENYTIVHANKRFRDKHGDCLGMFCHQFLMKQDGICDCCMSGYVLTRNKNKKCHGCSCEGRNSGIQTFHRPISGKDGKKYVLKSTIEMDKLYTCLNDSADEKEYTHENSSNSFWSMCSSCKKVKDDESRWINLENFLIQYFNIIISHGICPDCIEKLYPGILQDQKSKQ
jgi:PAS domain